MADPLVSIVMPVYNQRKFVADSICSVLRQTVDDFEFIIVDDGSLDGSYEICETYAKLDPRIRLNKRNYNGGQAVATNDGGRVARGKYMAWHQSDDNYHPQFLEWTLEAAEAGAEVVFGQYKYIAEDNSIGAGPFPEVIAWDFEKFKTNCYLCCGAMLYTRAAYNEVGGYDETFNTSVDWDFGLRVCKDREVAVLQRVLFYYRKQHPWSNRTRISEKVRGRDRARIRQGNYG
jgi:glycosyltransferase involved in cell wall biosynthesis